MSRRTEREKTLSNILPGIVRDKGWEIQMDLHSIFPIWKSLMDSDVAEHARPLKISKGTLWVEAENSAWLQQFQFRKIMMLDTLNNSLKKSQIKDIRFTLPDGSSKKEAEEKKVHFRAPSPEDIKNFEEQIAFIDDKATRDALMRFWYLNKACIREK